jgi:hypothetical protein
MHHTSSNLLFQPLLLLFKLSLLPLAGFILVQNHKDGHLAARRLVDAAMMMSDDAACIR